MRGQASAVPSFINNKTARLIITRSLHTHQAISSCLQHCLRSARYLSDFQSSSSPSVFIHRLPMLQTLIILFPFLRFVSTHTHIACLYPCYVSRVWALQEGVESCRKRQRKMPPPFTCTPTFSFQAFGSRRLITFISELQEVVLLGPVPSPFRARISPLVTGMTVSLSIMPKRTPPRLPSRP